MTAIPNPQPKEVFNYKEYLEFMESKKVRHGAERSRVRTSLHSDILP